VTDDPDNTLLYSDLVVDNMRVSGGCERWSLFASSLSQLEYGPKKSVSLALYAVSELNMELNNTAAQCTDKNALLEITKALESATAGLKTVMCDGLQWNIQWCGGYVNICANCAVMSCDRDFLCGGRPLSLSGCGPLGCPSSASRSGGLAQILVLQLGYKSPSPKILSEVIKSTSASIFISMQLSYPGFVYCLSLPASSSRNFDVTPGIVKFWGTMSTIQTFGSNYSLTLVLDGLVPATDYSVYCLTMSLDKMEMSGTALREQRRSLKTLCCKTVSVYARETVVKQGVDLYNAITVVYDSAPASDVVMFLRCTIDNVADVAVYPFFSEAVELQASSLALEYSIGFRADVPGVYKFDFWLAGESGAKYRVVYKGDVAAIEVLERWAQPPPPLLKSVAFSNDGLFVEIKFDSSTDRAALANIFLCSELFNFTAAATTKCQWESSVKVMAYASKEGSIGPGDIVTLRQSKLKAACPMEANCASWTYTAQRSAVVLAPLNPVVPVVYISSPSVVGECDDLTLDLSGSSGTGGRKWKSIEFNVQSDDHNASNIKAFLNSANYQITPPTSIPRRFLSVGKNYLFAATLCNFLGGCSSAVANVVVSFGSIPIVSFVGLQRVTLNRRDELSLAATAHTSTCGGGKTFSNLAFFWTLSSDTGVLAGNNFVSTSKDPKKYKLSPNTLTVGRYYSAKVAVLHQESSKSASATATIFVAPSAVVASISGGSERSIKIGYTLKIDGSGSYDEDTGDRSSLTFVWSCVQSAPVYSPACPLVGDFASSFSFLEISAISQIATATARVTLVVFDSTRRAETTVDILLIPAAAPVVLITSSVLKINPQEKLKLSGQVSMEANGQVNWSADGAPVDMSKVSLTPLMSVISGVSSLTVRSFNLVLTPSSLPERSVFTFRLTCVLNTGQASSAAITIKTNGPPLGGVLTTQPVEGYMLQTEFQLITSQWMDDDLPLTYEFGYVSWGSLMVVQSRSFKSFTSSTLPAGHDSVGSRVPLMVQAFDSLSANRTQSMDVIVKVVTLTTADLSDRLDNLYSVDSVDATKKALAIITSTINTINCTMAPDCGALNRQSCSSVSGSCGECDSGYVGAAGNANTLCIPTNRGHFTTAPAGGSVACSEDIDCHDVSWTTCVSGVCVELSQRCPQDCSGNGECGYRDTSYHTSVADCRQSDTRCEAYCQCGEGYKGPACEITVGEMQQRQVLRGKLISSLKNVTRSEDADASSVASWISYLNAVVKQREELSLRSLIDIYDICEYILDQLDELKLSYDTTLTLFSVLDVVSGAEKSLLMEGGDPEDSFVRYQWQGRSVAELVQTLSSRVASDMESGQDSISRIQSSMRLSVAKVGSSDTDAILAAPQTAIEVFNGQLPHSVQISPHQNQKQMSVSLVEKPPILQIGYNANWTSNTLKVTLSSDANDDSGGARTIVIVLQNLLAQEYTNRTDDFTVTTVCLSGEFLKRNYSCPSGYVVGHNCTGKSEVIVSKCPVVLRRPLCAVVGYDSNMCTMTSYTASNTTCLCRLSLSGRRRLNTADGTMDKTEEVEVVAMTVFVVVAFVDTLTGADELTVGGLKDSLMVIYMFGALW
jgi:hypothetical protein